MTYTRIPPVSGAGSIVSKPTTSPIPISDPSTTNYHQIPGTLGVSNVPPPTATAPTLSMSDQTQSSGSYVIYDTLRATATTPDATDFVVTTGVDLYESGVLVGSMFEDPENTWTYDIPSVTAGAKSYVARRNFAGGTKDSTPVALTVLGEMTPDQVTSATLAAWWRSTDLLTVSTVLTSAGTAPPVIALAGSRVETSQVNIVMGTPNSGAPGTAKVNVSLNQVQVLTNQSTTAATIDIPTSGIDITFPGAGTYSGNNTWQDQATSWQDKTGNAWIAGTSAANQRPDIVHNAGASGTTYGDFGVPLFNGSAHRFLRTDTAGDFANTFFGGSENSFEVWIFCDVTGLTGTHVPFAVGHSSDANQPLCSIRFDSTSGLQVRRRATAANDKILSAAIKSHTGPHLIRWSFDGTTSTVWDNGTPLIGPGSEVSGTQTRGASITLNQCSIGCQIHTSSVSFYTGYIYEILVFNGPLSVVEAQQLLGYIR